MDWVVDEVVNFWGGQAGDGVFDSAVGFDYGKVGGDGWDGWMEARVLGW